MPPRVANLTGFHYYGLVRNKVIPMNRATLALLLAMLAWGSSVTVADAALAELSAADLLLLETLAGTGAVVLACLATGRPVTGRWRPAFALGSLEPGIATSSPTSGSP